MHVDLSLLFLLTIIILVMLRFRHQNDGLTVVEFLLCGAWGFLLASSSFAPAVGSIIDAAVKAASR